MSELNGVSMNNLAVAAFLGDRPEFAAGVSAVDVDGRREMILPSEAMPAFGHWAAANKLINRADVAEVLATLPAGGGVRQ